MDSEIRTYHGWPDDSYNTNVNEPAVVRLHRLFCWLGQHRRNPLGCCVACGYDDLEPHEIEHD